MIPFRIKAANETLVGGGTISGDDFPPPDSAQLSCIWKGEYEPINGVYEYELKTGESGRIRIKIEAVTQPDADSKTVTGEISKAQSDEPLTEAVKEPVYSRRDIKQAYRAGLADAVYKRLPEDLGEIAKRLGLDDWNWAAEQFDGLDARTIAMGGAAFFVREMLDVEPIFLKVTDSEDTVYDVFFGPEVNGFTITAKASEELENDVTGDVTEIRLDAQMKYR